MCSNGTCIILVDAMNLEEIRIVQSEESVGSEWLTRTSMAAKRALGMSDSSFSMSIGRQYGANFPVEVRTLRNDRASCSCVMVSSASVFVTF